MGSFSQFHCFRQFLPPIIAELQLAMLINEMAGEQKRIQNCLKTHRKLMGLSQRDVMRLLKLDSTSMISRWERGVSMPSGINLLKLSLLYKTLVNKLYYGYGKELQAELFPDEKGIFFRRTKRVHNRSVRGP